MICNSGQNPDLRFDRPRDTISSLRHTISTQSLGYFQTFICGSLSLVSLDYFSEIFSSRVAESHLTTWHRGWVYFLLLLFCSFLTSQHLTITSSQKHFVLSYYFRLCVVLLSLIRSSNFVRLFHLQIIQTTPKL